MKRLVPSLMLVAIMQIGCQSVLAQSDSFQTFWRKFDSDDDAHYFKVSGFVVRSVLAMAGEAEAKEAVRGIHKVRLAVVPRNAFKEQGVTVNGFRNVLRQDDFSEMMEFREDGDQVTVYSNSPSHRDDQCYMMLVESDEEVVLIEVTGYVNEAYFKNLVKLQNQKT